MKGILSAFALMMGLSLVVCILAMIVKASTNRIVKSLCGNDEPRTELPPESDPDVIGEFSYRYPTRTWGPR